MKNNYPVIILILVAAFVCLSAMNPTGAFDASAQTNFAPVAEKTPPKPKATPMPSKKPTTRSASVSAMIKPEIIVADLYKQHDMDKSPFFQSESRSLVDKYFSEKLADMIWNDAITSGGEVGALGADPLYNAQDTDIKNFKVGASDIKGKSASVPVTFTNFGEKQIIIFEFIQEKGAWKVDNIKYSEGFTLVGLFEENAP